MFQNGICAQYIVRHDVKLPLSTAALKKAVILQAKLLI